MNTSHDARNAQLTRLAEALFRFAASLDQTLNGHVRQAAIDLAGAVAASDEKGIASALARAQGAMTIGQRMGFIAESDAVVIEGAISRSRQIALPEPAKEAEEVVVADVAEFAGIAQDMPRIETAQRSEPVVQERVAQPAAAMPDAARAESRPMPVAHVRIEQVAASAPSSAAERQERIVAAIRRNPNARMRDLLAALPGVSERTIRYDLERLVSSGKIEREGVGGPATWYRVRAGVTTS